MININQVLLGRSGQETLFRLTRNRWWIPHMMRLMRRAIVMSTSLLSLLSCTLNLYWSCLYPGHYRRKHINDWIHTSHRRREWVCSPVSLSVYSDVIFWELWVPAPSHCGVYIALGKDTHMASQECRHFGQRTLGWVCPFSLSCQLLRVEAWWCPSEGQLCGVNGIGGIFIAVVRYWIWPHGGPPLLYSGQTRDDPLVGKHEKWSMLFVKTAHENVQIFFSPGGGEHLPNVSVQHEVHPALTQLCKANFCQQNCQRKLRWFGCTFQSAMSAIIIN